MHVQCSKRLASVHIRIVCACVFRPLKSRMFTLIKQTSMKQKRSRFYVHKFA